jgi:hypothetical protein
VHCFFNAITFGHWIKEQSNLSQNDAFITYAIHDMFKAILRMKPSHSGSRSWAHQFDDFFDPIKTRAQAAAIFDNFATAFEVASRHGESIRQGKQLQVSSSIPT